MKNEILMMSKIQSGGASTLLTSILVISVLGVLLFLILNRNQKLKYLKKLTSVALILTIFLLPFSNLLNVKAEVVTITTDDTKPLASDNNFKYVTNKAKLTISGDNETDTFIAYKILDVYYNETTNEMTYDFTTDFKTFIDQLPSDDSFKDLDISGYQKLTGDNSDGSAGRGITTPSTLNKLVSKYATYLKKVENITGIDSFTVNESNKHESTAAVGVGSYLILPKEIVEKAVISDGILALDLYTYVVAVGNVLFTVENNAWSLSGVTVDVKENYLDNFSILINKNIKSFGDIEEINSDITYSASQNLYLLTGGDGNYDEAPTNTESSILSNTEIMSKIGNKELIFPKGITLDSIYDMSDEDEGKKEATIRDGTIYIMYNNEEKRYADITNDTINNKLVLSNVNFDATAALLLKFKVDNNVSVGSTTNVDKLNDYGNKIITNVTYLKNPYVDITGMDQATAEANVLGMGTITNTVYTHGVKVTNKDNNENTLTGGEFNICTDKDCNTIIGTTSVTNDIIQFRGLNDTDTYYLKQKKAPTGYRLLTDAIELNPTSLDKEVGLYDVTVTNTKMGLLPSTGGLGTVFYTLIGLIVIGIGAYEIIKYSKKQVNS